MKLKTFVTVQKGGFGSGPQRYCLVWPTSGTDTTKESFDGDMPLGDLINGEFFFRRHGTKHEDSLGHISTGEKNYLIGLTKDLYLVFIYATHNTR
ncbi:hypothetical protein TNCT_498281 [Trichonephila clavata]|uniref:Uncharacterized protein n=1 Tax=Trichonephila clavata TaxID=2740835 RepID=A0A8X6LY42_TRICU|nr:hypothetical protein TNCT_498281 [Trichonephila clavata]